MTTDLPEAGRCDISVRGVVRSWQLQGSWTADLRVVRTLLHAHMTVSRRFSLVLSMTAIVLAVGGCALGHAGQPGPGVAQDIACAFDFDFAPTIDSDGEKLRAVVECAPTADCSDRRTVLTGSTFDFSIEAPTQSDGVELRVASTDTKVIQLSGYDSKPDVCDGVVQLSGSVSFDHPGPGRLFFAGDLRRSTDSRSACTMRITWTSRPSKA